MKKFRYLPEAVALYLFFFLCKALGLDRASALGGWLGRTIGPRLGATRRAYAQLRRALPDLSSARCDEIIKDMWDHLGRVAAEYPHLAQIAAERTEVAGLEKIQALKDNGRGGIVFSGHIGNWEVLPFHAPRAAGVPLESVYRRLNNPYANRLLEKIRNGSGAARNHAKSKSGTRQMVGSLADGRHIIILIDQKYNEGIAALFFGRPAMTSTAFVQLAQKFSCPLVPARCERLEGAHFKVTYFDPLPVTDAQEHKLPESAVIEQAHALLESWITERPAQWLWLHRRWPGKEYQE